MESCHAATYTVTIVARLTVLGVCVCVCVCVRACVCADDIVETANEGDGAAVAKEPEAQGQMGLGHSNLLWSCPAGQVGSANGCVDRPKPPRKKRNAAEKERARRELLTTNRVMNEYLAEHGSGKLTAEDTTAAIKAAEEYLYVYGPDSDVNMGWTPKEEHAQRTAFDAMRNELQVRLDASAKAVEEAEAQVEDVEAHTRDLEAILDPIAKHSQEMGVKDVNSQQVSLMQELVQLVRVSQLSPSALPWRHSSPEHPAVWD
eukprot:COSAG02_NODE_19_length_53976_cov_37.338512_17_plen_260_part_00